MAGRRREVGVKDGDEFARGALHALGERARLEALAMGAVMIGDGMAGARVFTDQARADDARLVRRVVEHLNFQPVAGVFDARHRFQQALHHVSLVVNRELDGNARQCLELPLGLRRLAAILHVEINQTIAMNAVDRKDDQDGEIRNQDGKVKGIGLINAAKRVLVKDLVEIIAERLDHRVCGRHQNGKKKLMHRISSAWKKAPTAFRKAVFAAGRATLEPLPKRVLASPWDAAGLVSFARRGRHDPTTTVTGFDGLLYTQCPSVKHVSNASG